MIHKVEEEKIVINYSYNIAFSIFELGLNRQWALRRLAFGIIIRNNVPEGAWWHSGRASDSELRGPGFDPHMRHRVVSLSKTH